MAPPRRSGVTGHVELVAALRELAQSITPADIDKAAVESLDPMLKDTKERIRLNRNYAGKYPGFPDPATPRKGGYVDQGVIVRKDEGNSKTQRSYKLGATKRARYVLHLLEFGTAPHYQPNFRGGFMHPGATPRPAMTPAFEEHKDDVPTAFGEKIWLSLSAKASTLNKKTPRNRR